MTKILLLLFFITHTHISIAEVDTKQSTKTLITNVYDEFGRGNYNSVISTLDIIQKRLKKDSANYNEILGLINYWRGMSYSRLNDYEFAEKYLKEAIDLNYRTQDIFYEYGQVLYVSDKYKRARIAFKRSFKSGYKKGVSLYYIAFISQELNDHKKAVSFYSMIEKLPEEEKKDVLQAARMQIGDIYLKKIEKLPDSFKDVEKYVIPQYQKALEFDKESNLAKSIKLKIEDLQRRYELVLFRMRNGRPTNRPPYYLRANLLYGSNNNVTALPEEDKVSASEEDYASTYYSAGVFGRYSFYPNSTFSYAPEFNISTTRYFSESSDVYGLDNYSLNGAIKFNFEHMYNNAPATFFLDLGYTHTADGSDAALEEKKELAFASKTTSMTVSEEVQFWLGNPSVFRFQYSQTVDDDTTQNLSNKVFNYEQIVAAGNTTLFFLTSYNMTRYDEAEQDTSDNNALTLRMDAIFLTFYNLFNPSLYISNTQTNYINDDDRGTTQLMTYGVNLNRPLSRKFFITLDYSLSAQTAEDDSDNYDQQVVTLNLDYIY